MYCQECGNKQPDIAKFCHNCGKKLSGENEKLSTTIKSTAVLTNVNNDSLPGKNKNTVWALIIVPPIGLVLILIGYAITTFVANQIVLTPSSSTTIDIIKVALGLLGILSMLGIIIGIPIGIVLLKKKRKNKDFEFDPRSGKGNSSVIPEEIKGWNWGAFLLEPLWGLSHSVWLSLLTFVPLVNFIVIIYLGIKGNELAWKKNKWKNVDDFKQTQKKWAIWAPALLGISILLGIIGSFLSSTDQNTQNNTYTTGSINSTEMIINETVQGIKNSVTFPYQINKFITWTDVTAGTDAINYHYTLSGVDYSQLTNAYFKNNLISTVCEDNDVKNLLNKGINAQYSYVAKDANQFYFVSINKYDCSSY